MNNNAIARPCYVGPSDLSQCSGVVYEAVVCDVSGSMSVEAFEPGKSKRKTMCRAGKRFLEAKLVYRPQDFVAVIGYESTATLCCDFLNVGDDYAGIRFAFKEVKTLASGGTEMAKGLQIAHDLIRRLHVDSHRGPNLVRVLAYTDGHDGTTRRALRIAGELKARGVLVETFGVAKSPTEVGEAFLQKVATQDENGFIHYRFLGDAEAIHETFQSLARDSLTYTE